MDDPTVRLHVEQIGSGPTVVLSHGLGDTAATWSAVVPALATEQSVVTWDLRGHGTSDAPPTAGGYSMEAAVGDLVDVIEQTMSAREQVHLVGHSLGGLLSMAVALRQPERVRSLTMIASGPGYRDPASRDRWNRYVDEAVLRMPVPPEAARLAHQTDSEVIDRAATLEPPLLVIVGERDTRFHAGAAYLERTVQGSVVRWLPGAGHFPQRTHAPEVARLVHDHAEDRAHS